jgi:hypothetical protein
MTTINGHDRGLFKPAEPQVEFGTVTPIKTPREAGRALRASGQGAFTGVECCQTDVQVKARFVVHH